MNEKDFKSVYVDALDSAASGAAMPSGQAIVAFLELCIEEWKERSIGAHPDDVLRSHGAIVKLREKLVEIQRQVDKRTR